MELLLHGYYIEMKVDADSSSTVGYILREKGAVSVFETGEFLFKLGIFKVLHGLISIFL
jgi:hypothetical protein